MRNKILTTLCMLVGALAALCIGILLLTWLSGEKRPFVGRNGLLELMLAISFVLSVLIYGANWVKDLLYPSGDRDGGVGFTGSCRFGTGYYISEGVLFAKLTINPDSLHIQGGLGAFWAPNLFFCNFLIRKDEIIRISQFSTALFGGGFQIEHNCSEAPPFIVFSTLRFTETVRELERLDYKFNWNLPT
jgi:hypothetical protein